MTTTAEQLTAPQQQTLGYGSPGVVRPITFAQFDPGLGTLVEVDLTVVSELNGTVSVENLGAAAATVTVSLPGTVTLQSPSGLTMTTAYPSLTTNLNLGAFDGSQDFGGSSGSVASNIQATATSLAYFGLTGSIDQAAFTGNGSVSLSFNSQVLGAESGGANLFSELQSQTGAEVTLQYGYVAAGSGQNSGGGSGGSGSTLIVSSPSGYTIDFPDSSTTATQTFTIPDATTDWTQQVAVSRFDPSLGTLLGVNVGLVGNVVGGFAAENLANTLVVATAEQAAMLDLSLPGTTTLSVEPFVPLQNLNLGSFDGTSDFSGSSGASVQGVSDNIDPSITQTVTDATALAAFTGTGTEALTLATTGSSAVNGSGNMLTQLTQQSGGTVTVSYTYAPSTLACFAAGTRIATPDGPIAVQQLHVGQSVSLASGGSAPIVWIGHRSIDCRRHAQPETVWPVHIRAGAFAPHVPERDLVLSPDHAVFFEGVLIPVRYLLNDSTIVQQRLDRIAYYHIELARHDLLLAEGLAAESFLDTGNRSAFGNVGPVIQAHPNFTSLAWEAAGCAPLVVTGPPVEAARAQLDARARVLRIPTRRAA